MDIINWVYILASARNGTLFEGSTSDLVARMAEHRSGKGSKFVWKHRIFTLVYFEVSNSKEDALHRKHQLKRWARDWKKKLIEADNPRWLDLTEKAREAVGYE